ncbi:hypothetical protein O6H91_17G005700 [Diphasiastrum complanatum]|nr:hypothetical protein O6H91_17G005700 [Diphasiastrum complanatum]
MTQKWFPTSSTVQRRFTNAQDLKAIEGLAKADVLIGKEPTQQGASESMYRDMKSMFGKWEFSPVDLENPFPNNNGSVHIWQGDDDLLVSVRLQRYIHGRLPWIHYHELPGQGHLLVGIKNLPDEILSALLIRDEKVLD